VKQLVLLAPTREVFHVLKVVDVVGTTAAENIFDHKTIIANKLRVLQTVAVPTQISVDLIRLHYWCQMLLETSRRGHTSNADQWKMAERENVRRGFCKFRDLIICPFPPLLSRKVRKWTDGLFAKLVLAVVTAETELILFDEVHLHVFIKDVRYSVESLGKLPSCANFTVRILCGQISLEVVIARRHIPWNEQALVRIDVFKRRLKSRVGDVRDARTIELIARRDQEVWLRFRGVFAQSRCRLSLNRRDIRRFRDSTPIAVVIESERRAH